jgi:hypothetical protein
MLCEASTPWELENDMLGKTKVELTSCYIGMFAGTIFDGDTAVI